MVSKKTEGVFVGGAVVTKAWREVVTRVLLFFLIFPMTVLVGLFALVWIASLGHVNFNRVVWGTFERVGDRVSRD